MASTSTSSTQHTSVPAPRAVAADQAPRRVLEQATGVLYEVVEGLDEAAVRGRSLLPGWSRAHVITHLARNADALVNLLTWARTGVEHLMYASRADRDADIEEGSPGGDCRCCGRTWTRRASVSPRRRASCPTRRGTRRSCTPKGRPLQARQVPWLRLREVWFHLIDLDRGIGFDDLPADFVEEFLDDVVRQFEGRHGRAARCGSRRHCRTGVSGAGSSTEPGSSATVRGSASRMLGWLTGRERRGAACSGTVPELPGWA